MNTSHDPMQNPDADILNLYFARDERAIAETDARYDHMEGQWELLREEKKQVSVNALDPTGAAVPCGEFRLYMDSCEVFQFGNERHIAATTDRIFPHG